VFADSGNGAHALVPIDLPNTPEATDLIRRVLLALDARFPAAEFGGAKLDTTVFNAARITRCYGTINVRGDGLPTRPHRRSCLTAVPGDVRNVSVDQLRQLAALAPAETTGARPHGAAPAPPGRRTYAPVDLVEIFRAQDLYLKALPGGRHAVVCPFGGAAHASTTSSTVIFDPQSPGAPWAFHCYGCDHRVGDVFRYFQIGTSATNGHHVASHTADASWAHATPARTEVHTPDPVRDLLQAHVLPMQTVETFTHRLFHRIPPLALTYRTSNRSGYSSGGSRSGIGRGAGHPSTS
jgi:hypothetical protein